MTSKKETGTAPAAEAAETSWGAVANDETAGRRRNLVLFIVNLSHLINHVQSSMVSLLYPVMMGELGFGYFQIGLLQSIYGFAAQGCQVLYGFLVRFYSRSVLLGTGNIVLGLCGLATGASQNFFQVAATRTVAGAGSSAQHPVGSAILVSYFPKARGRVLTGTNSAGNLGGLLAPAIVGALLLVGNWRLVFYVVAVPSLIMGFFYFFFRDIVTVAGGSKKEKAKATMADYLTCLKNRNVLMVSLTQMAGAAGRGTGINVAFLSAFFMKALHVNVSVAAVLLMIYQGGALVGPIFLGWLSDRMDRKLTVQLILLFSTASTLWLLLHEGFTAALVLNLIVYGSVVNARGSLTQAMVSDSVPMHLIDAAFSLYFFIGFISGPLWTFIMGWIIDAYGFRQAFTVVSMSYLIGMVMMSFTTRIKPEETAEA